MSHDNCTIERCTANNNFTILPNEILQSSELSADATLVLVYLLSCKADWVITPKNVWKSKNISRDRVYKAFDELMNIGYMEKKDITQGNLRGKVKYRVSYLKKFLRRPGSQDPEIRDTENQYTNKKHREKETSEKKQQQRCEVSSNDLAPPVVVFSSFQKLNIPQEVKERYTGKMDNVKAEKLVARVTAWKDRTSDLKACSVILDRWDEWEDEEPEGVIKARNTSYLEGLGKLDGKVLGRYKIVVGHDYVGFQGSVTNGRDYHVFYTDSRTFIRDVSEFYEKHKPKVKDE